MHQKAHAITVQSSNGCGSGGLVDAHLAELACSRTNTGSWRHGSGRLRFVARWLGGSMALLHHQPCQPTTCLLYSYFLTAKHSPRTIKPAWQRWLRRGGWLRHDATPSAEGPAVCCSRHVRASFVRHGPAGQVEAAGCGWTHTARCAAVPPPPPRRHFESVRTLAGFICLSTCLAIA